MNHSASICVALCQVLLALAMAVKPATAEVAPAVTATLSNGVTLVARRDNVAPRVAISLLVRAGAADETPESAGWRRLLTDAMLRASLVSATATAKPAAKTGKDAAAGSPEPDKEPAAAPSTRPVLPVHTFVDRARLAERWGGRLGASVGDDVIEFWVVGDSAGTGPLLDLLLESVMRPRLSDGDIARARERLLARIEADEGNVALRASNALVSQLYRDARGAPVAYGLPSFGTPTSLNDLSADKLRRLYKTYFKPARIVVGVTGDTRLATLRAKLEDMGEPAKPAGALNVPFFSPPSNNQPPLTVRQMRTNNAWVFVAYVTAGLNSADYPALRVMAAALTQSSKARLPKRLFDLNNKRAAGADYDTSTYQVAGQVTPRRFAGDLVVFAQTGPQNVESTKNIMLDEVRKLGEKPLTPVELASARIFARGGWSVEREGLRDRAFQAALASALSAPADPTWPRRIAAVTAADVQRVARKYLGHYVVALIMPEE